jgi:hypothetical protein
MKKISTWMLAAILTLCGTTMLTSCSTDDNPAQPSKPAVEAKDIVGQWIMELQGGTVEPADPEEGVDYPKDADGITVIYHFADDGSGWKEMNIMKGKEVVFVPFSRYEALFKYTVEPNGSVTVMFLDEDGNANDVEDGLLYEDGKLVTLNGDVSFILSRATEQQQKAYQEMADAWYGGSDRRRSTKGVSNGDFKWTDSHAVTEKDR